MTLGEKLLGRETAASLHEGLARLRLTVMWTYRWPLALLAGWLVHVVLRLSLVNWGVPLPWWLDDVTFLLAGRTLAGGQGANVFGATFHEVGYGLLVIPAYLISDELTFVHRYAMTVNALIGASVLILAFLALRRLGLSRRAAYVSAHAAALLPAGLFYGQIAIADAVFPAVVLGWLLLLHAWLSGRGPAHLAGASLVVGYAYALHTRGQFILIIHLAVVAVVLWRGWAPRQGVWRAGQILTVMVASAWALNRWLRATLYSDVVNPLGETLRSRVTSPDGWGWTLALGAGQAWYQIVGAWGVGGLGLAALVWALLHRGTPVPTKAIAAALLATMTAVALLSAAALIDEDRVSNFAYGRYLHPFQAALFILGVAVLARAPRARLLQAAQAVAALAAAACAILVLHAGDRLKHDLYLPGDFLEMQFLTWSWSALRPVHGTVAALLILILLVLAITSGKGGGRPMIAIGAGLAVLHLVVGVVVRHKDVDTIVGQIRNVNLKAAGLTSADRVAVDGQDPNRWRHGMVAIQTPHSPLYFDPRDPQSLPSEATLVVVPPAQFGAGPASASWPAAPPGWNPVLANWELVAWRRTAPPRQ
ncbi:hypothetical protein [Actinomadura alba]|uniref:4-amino-4-deoxy-L-arabinose transferase n=1 Tax=Actinomadura alba TaxID=406431 RepID=A0ABR7LL94_9ACTN|nr:hypothetical protein [Actinomadura alba]MBC6465536.1 hypothetical protein [Actinomadura alba]